MKKSDLLPILIISISIITEIPFLHKNNLSFENDHNHNANEFILNEQNGISISLDGTNFNKGHLRILA